MENNEYMISHGGRWNCFLQTVSQRAIATVENISCLLLSLFPSSLHVLYVPF